MVYLSGCDLGRATGGLLGTGEFSAVCFCSGAAGVASSWEPGDESALLASRCFYTALRDGAQPAIALQASVKILAALHPREVHGLIRKLCSSFADSPMLAMHLLRGCAAAEASCDSNGDSDESEVSYPNFSSRMRGEDAQSESVALDVPPASASLPTWCVAPWLWSSYRVFCSARDSTCPGWAVYWFRCFLLVLWFHWLDWLCVHAIEESYA